MTKLKVGEAEVLCYDRNKKVDRRKVRRYYLAWRAARGIQERCDKESCCFHANPLEWNGAPLRLELDHITGNSRDNAPDNLQLLCPNCHSQQPTGGGKNIGRIRNQMKDGYQVRDCNSDRIDG